MRGRETKENGRADSALFSMAYGEIYPTIVRLALGFTFELYETTLKEVICERTRVVGYPRTVTGGGKGHNKIQVKMTGKTE